MHFSKHITRPNPRSRQKLNQMPNQIGSHKAVSNIIEQLEKDK